VAVAKAHQGLVGPRILHHHRHVHDPRLELEAVDVFRLLVYLFEARDQVVRVQHVRVDADHVRGVRRTDVCYALDALFPEPVRDGHSPKVDLQTHRLRQLDEDELVSPVAVARLRKLGPDAATHIRLHPAFP
jgi:hypothetical protein